MSPSSRQLALILLAVCPFIAGVRLPALIVSQRMAQSHMIHGRFGAARFGAARFGAVAFHGTTPAL